MSSEVKIDKFFRVCAFVDIDAIRANLTELHNNVKKYNQDVKLSAVIKADGYGHGAVAIAQNTSDLVDCYCVATIDEAIELRKNGITNDILVLGYTHYNRYPEALREDVVLTVFSYEMARLFDEEAKKAGKPGKVHIKIDTGMNRIGFKITDASSREEAFEECKKIGALENISITGAFTHLFAADEADKGSAKRQYGLFRAFMEELENAGISGITMHCSNSAAIMDLPEFENDMVRAGIALYGLMPSDEIQAKHLKLEAALSLKSHIINIKQIKKGETVGYGGTFEAPSDMMIATVPVGYGDGYQRRLSGKGSVLINGKRAKIVGRVCMDQFMVDVTDIPEAKLFDIVTLIGKDKDECISLEELGDISGVFNYEFACDINKRIPRAYIRNGEIIECKNYFDL